jgi:cytochrome oxidase assembly protein ShyY1
MRLAFRFRVIPFIATVVLVALGIALGNWQTRRAEEKAAIAQRYAVRSSAVLPKRGLLDPEGAMIFACGGATDNAGRLPPADATERFLRQSEYCRLRTTGEFVSAWPIFLDNRPNGGRAGFVLAMPFKIAGSNLHVLVLRGWLPRDPRDYARLPAFTTPQGRVEIEGIVLRSAGHVMQLGTPGTLKPGAIVQNLAPDEVARASGLRLQPFFVQQTSVQQTSAGQGDGLVRDWPAPATGIDKHRGYAFQWYALAAMAALFFVMTGFRSGRKQGV